ncbi:MAG: cation:proton antiporter regulatory subunit [Planctomycetota bacterium]
MIPLLSLLLIVSLSILATRVATIALVHTGMSREMARFQARSAFSGVGFTTSESEHTVNHPVRRRIIFTLMLLGNAGIITTVATVLLTFVAAAAGHPYLRLGGMAAGIVLLWALASSRWIDQRLSLAISKALNRFTDLRLRDYESLLHLAGGFRVDELAIREGDWLAGRSLRESDIREEGLNVLAIQRMDGSFVGTPQPDDVLAAGDTVIVYGRDAAIEEIDRRRHDHSGDRAHRSAVVSHQAMVAQRDEACDASTPALPAVRDDDGDEVADAAGDSDV